MRNAVSFVGMRRLFPATVSAITRKGRTKCGHGGGTTISPKRVALAASSDIIDELVHKIKQLAMPRPASRREKFYRHFVIDEDSGCWLWTGPFGRGGYGQFTYNYRRTSAHRAAYEIFIGLIPPGHGHHGTCVLHRCDVRHCVNPDHLFLGTVQENVVDMMQKGRQNSREEKLTFAERETICRRYLAGESQNALAAEHGVSQARVSYIVRVEAIRWVPDIVDQLEARRRFELRRMKCPTIQEAEQA